MTGAQFGTEPLVGWRVWLLVESEDGVRLSSVVYRELWPVQEPMVNRCVESRCLGATWPDLSHSCGVHAFKERSLALEFPAHWEAVRLPMGAYPDSYVLGQVSMWGRVVEHEAGYRAQYAYPYVLLVPPHLGSTVDALRSAYRVDTEVAAH